MHNCFLIPEVYGNILDYLQKDSRSLASLALTCKHLSEGVLDTIWKDESRLSALLKILPPDIQAGIPGIYQDIFTTKSSPVRELTEEEFERLTFYSRRLRRLHLTRFDLGVLQTLFKSRCFRRGPLLPALTNLSVLVSPQILSSTAAHYLSFLLGSSVINLELNYPNLYTEQSVSPTPFFSVIRRSCQNLSNLKLYGVKWVSGKDARLRDEVVSLIESLKSLACLDATYFILPQTLLTHLTHLSSFRDLTLRVELQTQNDLSPLETLMLPSQLMRRLTIKQASSNLSPDASPHPPPSATLFSKMAQCANLKDFDLSTELDFTPSDRNHYVLDPIFSLSNLQRLNIDSWLLQNADNQWIVRVADAFPLLESLRFGIPTFDERKVGPKMTLEGLLPLLHNCPRLREIDVTVNCSPFSSDHLDKSRLGHVQSATFTHCPTEGNIEGVLQCILAMFPYAIRIRGHNIFALPWDHADRWDQINGGLIRAGKSA